jgi:hypothetical protein
MVQVDRLLEENQKKKAERISSITNNDFVASLLKVPGMPAAAQEARANPQQAKYNQQQRGRNN